MSERKIPVARPTVGVEEESAVVEVLRSGWLTQGPRVAEFEAAFARAVGAEHAIAVTSCTTALHLICVGLGIGRGDEVVCPSLSFIATANAVAHAGATPVFADVDARTFNVTVETVERAMGPRTKAILAVDQVGMPADLEPLRQLAQRNRVLLLEDAACAIGSRYRDVAIGKPFGAAVAFSFHPRKVLTTGEGGMITTDDGELAARLKRLRHHGMTVTDLDRHRSADRYLRESYAEIGWNYRMTDLQAAIGLVQLERLPQLVAKRRALAARYTERLRALPSVIPPFEPDDRRSNFQSYMIRLDGFSAATRDRIVDEMLRHGVTTRPGIMASHREPPYAARKVELPVTERLTDDSLVLPLYDDLSEADQDRVVEALRASLSSLS